MANTNTRDGRRTVLGALNALANRHRPRRSEGTNLNASIPTAGFGTPSAPSTTVTPLTTVFTSTTVTPAQSDGPPRSPLANPSHPTRRPVTQPPPPPYSDTGVEDRYEVLSSFDTIFVIDDSKSMEGPYWDEVEAVLANIAPVCTRYDKDGIDIYFLNHYNDQTGQADHARNIPTPGKASGGYNNIRDANEVVEIFGTVQPCGFTPTGNRLRSILQPYLRLYEEKLKEFRRDDKYSEFDRKKMKPINVIVITDGKPDDNLEEEIVKAAEKLDRLDAPADQIGIQFFQVGNEKGAAKYFQHLDDNLTNDFGGGHRDIVDTVTWDSYERATGRLGLSADGILKVLLGAVVRRLDRQSIEPAAVAQLARDGTGSRRNGSLGAAGGSL